MRRVKAAVGNVSQCLLFTTRSVYNYISKQRSRFRRARTPAEVETCPDIHIQPKTATGVIVDDHGCCDVDEVEVDDAQPVARTSGTSGTTAPEEGFHLFPLLPPELRLRIWQLACAVPRVVELLALDRGRGFRSSAAPRPPPVLHACLESREAAGRIYRRWFGVRLKVEEQQRQRQPPLDRRAIRINPVHDIAFIRNSNRSARRSEWDWVVGPNSKWRLQLRKLQRVAFVWDCNPMDLKDVSIWFSIRTTRQFWDLRELILLWVLDGADRSLMGRGANVFDSELHSTCHNCTCATEMRSAAERSREKILATWTTNGIWERLGREPPVITVMHWCTRGAESGQENVSLLN